jgi:signal transduction histidine kinase
MSEDAERQLRDTGLAFFGTITASVTHEIKNCLSIINECSGLLDDLLVGVAAGRDLDPDKLQRTTSRISRQVERADQIVKRLNKFAHSVDEPIQHLQPRDTIENLINLSLRLAAQKCVEVRANLTEEPFAITTNPYRMQQAVFACIELALAVSEPDTNLDITLGQENGGAVVMLTGPDLEPSEETAERRSLIEAMMSDLGGRLEILSVDGSRPGLILHFPQVMSIGG